MAQSKKKVQVEEIENPEPEEPKALMKVAKVQEVAIEEKPLIVLREWGAGIIVHECAQCGRQFDSRDEAVLHVVNHYPEKERQGVLDKLI